MKCYYQEIITQNKIRVFKVQKSQYPGGDTSRWISVSLRPAWSIKFWDSQGYIEKPFLKKSAFSKPKSYHEWDPQGKVIKDLGRQVVRHLD